MLRIAKGRQHEETLALLAEAGIRLDTQKRTLLVPARDFQAEILFLRDDDSQVRICAVRQGRNGYRR